MKNFLFINFIIFFFSCSNISNKYFEQLNDAFAKWYDSNHINYTLNNKTIYILNNKIDFKYIEEYILDLKRFKLELNQLSIKKFNKVNNYKFNSLEYKIEKLLYINEVEKPYLWNSTYYTEPLYNSLFILLSDTKVPLKDKIELYNHYLDNISLYINQSKKNLKYSNEILINRSIIHLNDILFLLDNSSSFIDYSKYTDENNILKKIKTKKILLVKFIEWLKEDLDKTFSIKDYSVYKPIYKFDLFDNEKVAIDFLKISINNIQQKLFDLALPTYLLENDEPIWIDKQDTTNVINFVLERNINFKVKDFESHQIKFNQNYNKINTFLIENELSEMKENMDIKFLDYKMFNEKPGPHKTSNSFSKPITVILGNSFYDFNNSRVNKFIVESILPRDLFNRLHSYKTISLYSNLNDYVWGKLMSRILIESGFNNIDKNYEFVFYLDLLRDFNNIFIKYNYLNNDLSFNESIKLLNNNSFYNNEEAFHIYNELINDNTDYNLSKYLAYIYISNLFDQLCLIENKFSFFEFVNSMMEYGFVNIKDYTKIIN